MRKNLSLPQIETVANHPLLALLPHAALERVLKFGRVCNYSAGRTIWKQGDASNGVHFLLSGGVRVSQKTLQGNHELLVKLFAAPAMFGEMEVLAELPQLESVKTLLPTQSLVLSSELFRWVLTTQAIFAANVSLHLACALAICTSLAQDLALCSVDERLAMLLCDYAQFGNDVGPNGVSIRVPLTVQQLSQDLAASRRAVTKAIKTFEDEGLVCKEPGRRLTIVNYEALAKKSASRLSVLPERLPTAQGIRLL